MGIRVGRVTNIYPSSGKVRVSFEDTGNTSAELAMLSFNGEYSMPAVGERVVTMHLDSGRSKGFVLGTYYGGGSQPKASGGYRKDFTDGAYAASQGGSYTLTADDITFICSHGSITAADIMERLEDMEEQLEELTERVEDLEAKV